MSDRLEDVVKGVEKLYQDGVIQPSPEPLPGHAEFLVQEMQGAEEFSAFVSPATADEVQRILAERETQPYIETEEVRGGSAPVTKLCLATDRKFARGWDAIFGKKPKK